MAIQRRSKQNNATQEMEEINVPQPAQGIPKDKSTRYHVEQQSLCVERQSCSWHPEIPTSKDNQKKHS
jgi:hypothetical protein